MVNFVKMRRIQWYYFHYVKHTHRDMNILHVFVNIKTAAQFLTQQVLLVKYDLATVRTRILFTLRQCIDYVSTLHVYSTSLIRCSQPHTYVIGV